MAGKYSSDTVGMGIRLTKDQRAALEAIAQRTGTEVSQLIRFAVDAIIEHYERNEQRLVLPINFDEIVSARSHPPRAEEGKKKPGNIEAKLKASVERAEAEERLNG